MEVKHYEKRETQNKTKTVKFTNGVNVHYWFQLVLVIYKSQTKLKVQNNTWQVNKRELGCEVVKVNKGLE